MNAVGVDGLSCGLSIALRGEGTEAVDPHGGGDAGHRRGRDAWRGAGACRNTTGSKVHDGDGRTVLSVINAPGNGNGVSREIYFRTPSLSGVMGPREHKYTHSDPA